MSVIKLNNDTYFSTDDGVVISKKQAASLVAKAALSSRNLTVDETFVHIKHKDAVTVSLELKGRNETIAPQNGFLVTVYLSGANGQLTRLYRNPVIDPADLTVARGSYEDYITLEFDK